MRVLMSLPVSEASCAKFIEKRDMGCTLDQQADREGVGHRGAWRGDRHASRCNGGAVDAIVIAAMLRWAAARIDLGGGQRGVQKLDDRRTAAITIEHVVFIRTEHRQISAGVDDTGMTTGRLRRWSGATLMAFLALLALSGFALFFVSDDRGQHLAALSHDLLGLGVTVFGIQHWFFASRSDMRKAASRPW